MKTQIVTMNPAKPSTVFIGYVWDIVAPTAMFFVLTKLGFKPVWGLVIGALTAIGSTVVNSVRQRRIDRVGVLVIVEIAISVIILFLWHAPRLLLVRPSLYSFIAGVYMIATSFHGKPLTYEGAYQAGTRGDVTRSAAFQTAWETSSRFRTTLRVEELAGGLRSSSTPSSVSLLSTTFQSPKRPSTRTSHI